jgi:hypothetical protein
MNSITTEKEVNIRSDQHAYRFSGKPSFFTCSKPDLSKVQCKRHSTTFNNYFFLLFFFEWSLAFSSGLSLGFLSSLTAWGVATALVVIEGRADDLLTPVLKTLSSTGPSPTDFVLGLAPGLPIDLGMVVVEYAGAGACKSLLKSPKVFLRLVRVGCRVEGDDC